MRVNFEFTIKLRNDKYSKDYSEFFESLTEILRVASILPVIPAKEAVIKLAVFSNRRPRESVAKAGVQGNRISPWVPVGVDGPYGIECARL